MNKCLRSGCPKTKEVDACAATRVTLGIHKFV